jgi:hypothetical protein
LNKHLVLQKNEANSESFLMTNNVSNFDSEFEEIEGTVVGESFSEREFPFHMPLFDKWDFSIHFERRERGGFELVLKRREERFVENCTFLCTEDETIGNQRASDGIKCSFELGFGGVLINWLSTDSGLLDFQVASFLEIVEVESTQTFCTMRVSGSDFEIDDPRMNGKSKSVFVESSVRDSNVGLSVICRRDY